MPELFVSITSSMQGHSDMSIGNVIGSNVCNLLLILGISTIIKSVKFQRETRLIELPICLSVTIIFTVLCNINNDVSRLEGIILIILFTLFIIYTVFMSIKGEKFDSEDKDVSKDEEEIKEMPVARSIIYIVLGIIGLKFGGDFTVNNSVIIVEHFGLSEKIIGLTILAIGTSLPELVTSVTAAIKGNSDIAIGNIIGSNIFNMLLIIGVSSVINPISYNPSYNVDLIILTLATLLLALFPLIPPKNEMTRKNGMIYLGMYIIYMIILFKL